MKAHYKDGAVTFQFSGGDVVSGGPITPRVIRDLNKIPSDIATPEEIAEAKAYLKSMNPKKGGKK